MLSSTLRDYQKNHNARLYKYKNNYEDNTEASFLEIESNIYTKYFDALTSMAKLFQDRTIKDMKYTHIHASLVLDLKKVDENIYYDIVTELKDNGGEIDFDRHLTIEEIMNELIEIDFKKLTNSITSAKRILNFIKDKQESMVPGEEIVAVKDEPKPEKPVNPYPIIFTSYEAFLIFDKLKTELGNTETPLKDYSFVFRKMVIDNLIFPNLKHAEFREFLEGFDIYIERINTLGEIGNLKYRESIYSSVK